MAFELSTAARALLVVVFVEFALSLALTLWRLITLLQEADSGDTEAIADTIAAAVLLVNLCTRRYYAARSAPRVEPPT